MLSNNSSLELFGKGVQLVPMADLLQRALHDVNCNILHTLQSAAAWQSTGTAVVVGTAMGADLSF
jgi:hypothetical protein